MLLSDGKMIIAWILHFEIRVDIIVSWKRDEFFQENTKSQPMPVGWDFFAFVVETNVWVSQQLAF